MVALYGKKIGMTQVFDDNGSLVPVTVLQLEPSLVVGNKSVSEHGYDAKLLAVFKARPKLLNKAKIGIFSDTHTPRRKIYEVRDFADKEQGAELGVEVFEGIDFVDVIGLSKGKGHQGVMRRHGSKGGPRAHGSKFHRLAGSTGHSANPSRVRKGTNMSGKMGNDKVTVQNLKLMSIDKEENVLLVKGAVPGAKGSQVLIRKSKKKGE